MRRSFGAGGAALLLGLLLGGCASWLPGWMPGSGQKGKAAREAAAAAPAKPAAATPKPAAAEAKPAKPAFEDDGVMDRIVAVVNNDVITLNELRENVLYYKVETRGQDTMSDEELAHRLLSRLIESRLQLQEADREKIAVDDTDLSEEIAARMKKMNLNTEEEFEAIVKKQGLTMEAVKKKLREQIMIAKVTRRKVAFRVSVTEQEVDRYLQENRAKLETGLTYHARHIMVAPDKERSDAGWAAALERANADYARLLAGADFAELAREVSQDATAKDGGDLGTLKRGELAEDIESRILALSPGQVSPPFRTDLGYHLVKLEAKEALEGEGLTRVRQQIRDILFRQKYQARLDAWLEEIKKRAIIEVRI
jgi:peptidyl-prolyl cis-trans isomerase SurA